MLSKNHLLLILLFFGGILACFPTYCYAEIVEGQAVIENGNVTKAREAARQDAMRTYVEMQVGVHVSSTTEVSQGMVVRDQILTHSDGYVQINRIVKESQSGDIYSVTLDLSANAKKIETAITDLKSRLEMLSDQNTSRSGIQVAVTGRDENGRAKPTGDLMRYVQSKLEDSGFSVYPNDEVAEYMDRQPDLDSLAVGAEIRRLSRNAQNEANSLLRGTLSTIAIERDGKYTKATVKASFELIGFDSAAANSYVDYFTAASPSYAEAIRKAEEMATQKAVESLGQKALKTVQSEFQGGMKHLKMTAIFQGITDRNGQGGQILQGLRTAGCRIIRSSYASDGSFRVFLETTSYTDVGELQDAILRNVGMGLQQGNENESAMGSRKLYFTF